MAKEGASCVDCCGVPLTCASDDALECFNNALLEYVGVRQSALPHWTKALELDPSFVLTHCALVSPASEQVLILTSRIFCYIDSNQE